MQKIRKTHQGIAHIGLIILVIAVIAAIGGIGYVVMNKGKDKTAQTATETAVKSAAKAECTNLNDKDLCKFYTSWKESKKYKMVSTGSDGSTSTIEVDGDNSHFVITGQYSMDVITIGKTYYTKAGDTWYKQNEVKPEEDVTADSKVNFDEPTDDTTATADKTTYKKIGKEACGSLTCFKYEVVDPQAEAGSHEYIWFDDKDYQIRKTVSENKDGTTTIVFEYTNVSVKAPTPVKELGPNQYIVPGQTEPMTLPSAADYQ